MTKNRIIIVVVLCLFSLIFLILFWKKGRFEKFSDKGVLDKNTGKIYIYNSEKKQIVEFDFVNKERKTFKVDNTK